MGASWRSGCSADHLNKSYHKLLTTTPTTYNTRPFTIEKRCPTKPELRITLISLRFVPRARLMSLASLAWCAVCLRFANKRIRICRVKFVWVTSRIQVLYKATRMASGCTRTSAHTFATFPTQKSTYQSQVSNKYVAYAGLTLVAKLDNLISQLRWLDCK